VIKSDNAITCSKDRGPCFTGALIATDPFDKKNNCGSLSLDNYEDRVVDGFNKLLQKKSFYTCFSITEMEVIGIKFTQ
jgi:hypothetical protein